MQRHNFFSSHKKIIMRNRNNNQSQQNTSTSKNNKRSGQETMGKRGQKIDKEDKASYQREQTGKRGTHGGNR
jgi:hypothetical protein